MATQEKKTVQESVPERRTDMVPFYAFKDNDKYKDDITVIVNGKAYKIQRGKRVMIPRHVYEVLENSQAQDLRTANLIERETSEYQAKAGAFE